MQIERIHRASGQAHKFKTWNGRFGPALDPKLCLLARFIHIWPNGAGKEIGEVIIEMLVSVPQTR